MPARDAFVIEAALSVKLPPAWTTPLLVKALSTVIVFAAPWLMLANILEPTALTDRSPSSKDIAPELLTAPVSLIIKLLALIPTLWLVSTPVPLTVMSTPRPLLWPLISNSAPD